METLVSVSDSERECADLPHDHRLIYRWCERPVSVTEIAARLVVPLNVVKVLIGDRPSTTMMLRALDGLHAL